MAEKAPTHTAEIRVRYAETDKMGIVYNGNYLTYFEIGRTSLLRAMGLPYSEIERRGFGLPLLEAHVNYRSPARYDDVLALTTTFEDLEGARMRLTYCIKRGSDVIAEGYTVHIFAQSESMRPARPPAFFLDMLRKQGSS